MSVGFGFAGGAQVERYGALDAAALSVLAQIRGERPAVDGIMVETSVVWRESA
ncbi:hypothetical protein [Agromyces aureus]|uniref:hypothetical protein n=1 Tax=Agromyces aureus TaxID=453304 RepID=UPI0012ED9B3A|nr:hypothetical protein [Agromyces aureus]